MCEYVSEQEDSVYKNVTSNFLKYEIGNKRTGFITDKLSRDESIVYPNGETITGSTCYYICPKIHVFPESSFTYAPHISMISVGTKVETPFTDFARVGFIDFRGINFGRDDIESLINNNSSYGFRAVANMFDGVYLPKCSRLDVGTLVCARFTASDCYIRNGIHLGKYVAQCYYEWIFSYTTIDDVSAQPETPVYCDKDFYVNGTLYLDKLNIPLDCIFGIMENASYQNASHQMGTASYQNEVGTWPVLSIGAFNADKLVAYFDEIITDEAREQMRAISEKVGNGEITPEDAINEIKQINYNLGVYFEFENVKRWVLQ